MLQNVTTFVTLITFFIFILSYIWEKNSLLEVEVYDHFVELRRKIDIRREEAKSHIDDLYMKMIDLTKKTGADYMQYMAKQASRALVRRKDDNLEDDKKAIDDQFRDPQFLIGNVKALKTKHTEEIEELKSRLKEFDEIKMQVKVNEFKSGVFFEAFFGSLSLVECSYSPLKSKIVNAKQFVDLMKLLKFSLNQKWALLYRASENGFGADDFHSKCDGRSNVLRGILVFNIN